MNPSNADIGIYFTGGSLNFARSLGPAAVNRHFPGYFWIYFVGPLLGSLLASGFYALLNRMRYQTCNPGQDYSEDEKLLKDESSSGVNHGSESPFKAGSHQRNVSGATAVNHNTILNNQIPPANHDIIANSQSPQEGFSPTNHAAYGQTVYENRATY